MNKRTWVAIHVVDLDGNILARKRGADGGKSGIDGGMIGPPGGHSEQGESLIDAAVRELFEETGLRTHRDFCNLVAIIEEPRGIVFCYTVGAHDRVGTLRHEQGHGSWFWMTLEQLRAEHLEGNLQQGIAVLLGFDRVAGSDLCLRPYLDASDVAP